METTDIQGQLIVAMPQLEDPNFHRAVVLMCEHGSHGAMGLVVNRTLPIGLDQVFESQGLTNPYSDEVPVYYGGPVQPEAGFLIYKGGHVYPDSRPVFEDVMLGTSVGILEDIAAADGPEDFLFALGYAGWGPGQLEDELTRNDWLLVPTDANLLFSLRPPERWEHAIRSLGIDPGLLSQTSGSA